MNPIATSIDQGAETSPALTAADLLSADAAAPIELGKVTVSRTFVVHIDSPSGPRKIEWFCLKNALDCVQRWLADDVATSIAMAYVDTNGELAINIFR